MITLRPGTERGASELDWLDSRHTFSFADYFDPAHMGFRALRVLNDDRVAPGRGFDTHPHRDMEILTVVLEGSLEHRDSLGNGSLIVPGEIQRMTAGTGIRHSEHNPSKTMPLHLLQIWIEPERRGLAPSYEQKSFPADMRRDQLKLVASRLGRNESVTIHQDADLYVSALNAGKQVEHYLREGRAAFIHVTRGRVAVSGKTLAPGDAAAIERERNLSIVAQEPSEFLLFDLA